MCFFPVYLQMLTSYATCMVQVIYPSWAEVQKVK
jgi:hypothetical protein